MIGARYNMLADIETQTTSRDEDTGQTKRDWAVDRTVECQIRSIASEGIRTVGSTERFNSDGSYDDDDFVRIRCKSRISKRDRVNNIRHRSGEKQYLHDDGTSEQFEVLGSEPIQSPFGKVVEYYVLLHKVQDE